MARLTGDDLERLRKHRSDDDAEALVEEIRRLRSLLDRVYQHVMPAIGTDELQAELELEVMAIRAEARRKAGN